MAISYRPVLTEDPPPPTSRSSSTTSTTTTTPPPPPPPPPSGGGGSGGVVVPSAAGVAPALAMQPATAVIVVRPSAGNVATPAPGHRVNPGVTVEIVPDPSNAGNAQVAKDSYAVLNGPRETLTPASTPRRYSGIRNTNEFWVSVANANEAVLIRVLQGA